MKAKSSIPEVVVRNGKPVAVILGINQYEALLERLEDVEDLKELAAMRRKPLKYKKLEEFLKEYSAPSAIVAKPIDKQLARKQKRHGFHGSNNI